MPSQKFWGISLLILVILIMATLFYMGFVMGVRSVTEEYLTSVCQYYQQLKTQSIQINFSNLTGLSS